MNKKMLMLMANTGKSEKGRRIGVEYEDWGAKDHYPTEEPYAYPPVEDKFRNRRVRERYDDWRFAPRGDHVNPWIDRRMPPIYDNRGERRMNPIGFVRKTGSDDATPQKYQEMEYMQDPDTIRGYATSDYAPWFDRQMAEEWTAGLENEDGTIGPHWTLDQAKQVMAQKNIGGSPIEFWAALNATYSDLCKVFKKYGINNMDAYVDFTKAFWLDDKDSVPNKLAAYYKYVVRR